MHACHTATYALSSSFTRRTVQQAHAQYNASYTFLQLQNKHAQTCSLLTLTLPGASAACDLLHSCLVTAGFDWHTRWVEASRTCGCAAGPWTNHTGWAACPLIAWLVVGRVPAGMGPAGMTMRQQQQQQQQQQQYNR
jgi:hypothetical protein